MARESKLRRISGTWEGLMVSKIAWEYNRMHVPDAVRHDGSESGRGRKEERIQVWTFPNINRFSVSCPDVGREVEISTSATSAARTLRR